ncbi:hypothetical protein F5884DRAFT_862747 [Xylogone sp. PMI_703]|nr:hypothetical protein F5884DRAFT_862747 [Xylogone sp. PMI_703]
MIVIRRAHGCMLIVILDTSKYRSRDHQQKISPLSYNRRLKQVFYKDAVTNAENQQRQNDQQHQHVLETLWLAVVSSDDTDNSQLSFNEPPRFGDLMGKHRKKVQRQPEDRNMKYYPRLISFVGNTNAGKSSLIEVLIGHLWDSGITDQDLHDILVPVVGNQDSVPTSSDIHLY